jgi:hypothetical protein
MIIEEAHRLKSVQEYYFSGKLKQIRKMRSEGKDVLNLGIGNPDMMPSPSSIEELKQTSELPGSHGYQSYTGIPELREAIGNWMKRTYSVVLDPDSEILPLIGSKEGIMHISMAFLNEGDQVLVPDPGYPAYEAVSRLVNAEVIRYPLDPSADWSPDLDFINSLDLSKVKIMWINYPNMPTGSDLSLSMAEKLIDLAKNKRFLIVNDNPYSMILNENPKSMLAVRGADSVLVELNSLSKSHNMAGWRLGWVAGKAEYLKSILKVKSNMDSGMFLPIQKAAVKALEAEKGWFDSLNAEYRKRRKMVWEILDFLGCTYDPGQSGMFVWAKIPDHIPDVASFTDHLLEKVHIFITPGFIFGKGGNRFVRMSLCNPTQILNEAMKRLNDIKKEELIIEQDIK